jgi:hypothetical protein
MLGCNLSAAELEHLWDVSPRRLFRKCEISGIVDSSIIVVLTFDIKQARGLTSTPIAFLPNTFDSTRVVPLPTKLSRIRSSFLLNADISLFGI